MAAAEGLNSVSFEGSGREAPDWLFDMTLRIWDISWSVAAEIVAGSGSRFFELSTTKLIFYASVPESLVKPK